MVDSEPEALPAPRELEARVAERVGGRQEARRERDAQLRHQRTKLLVVGDDLAAGVDGRQARQHEVVVVGERAAGRERQGEREGRSRKSRECRRKSHGSRR
jgi:hypothetical protein